MSILEGGIIQGSGQSTGGGGGGRSDAQINALIQTWVDENPSEFNSAISDWVSNNDDSITDILENSDFGANLQDGVAENLQASRRLEALTHELTVEYDYDWARDSDVLFSFTGTSPTPQNVGSLSYLNGVILSNTRRNQYVVMRVPRNLDANNIHNYRVVGVQSGHEDVVLNSWQLITFNTNYEYYGYAQIPGTSSYSRRDYLGGFGFRGESDQEVQRNTLYHGDLANDNHALPLQTYPIASAITPVAAANVGQNWFARRLMFSGGFTDPTINEKPVADGHFITFHTQIAGTGTARGIEALWTGENATYTNHTFSLPVGTFQMRLTLDHLSSDGRGVCLRFFRNLQSATDELVADLTFTSTPTQNLPSSALGGAQRAQAYPNILEIPYLSNTVENTLYYFVIFEKLQNNNVSNADTFGGSLEVRKLT